MEIQKPSYLQWSAWRWCEIFWVPLKTLIRPNTARRWNLCLSYQKKKNLKCDLSRNICRSVCAFRDEYEWISWYLPSTDALQPCRWGWAINWISASIRILAPHDHKSEVMKVKWLFCCISRAKCRSGWSGLDVLVVTLRGENHPHSTVITSVKYD